MVVAAVVAGGAALGTAVIQSNASNRAANAQVNASDRSTSELKDVSNQQIAASKEQYERQQALQEPFRQAGLSGQNKLLDYLGLSDRRTSEGYGTMGRSFGVKDFEVDPGYGFRLSEGLKALDRSAAARGGQVSGSSMKAAQRFGQGLASDEYMNAFNRFQTNRANTLQPLQSLAGVAQTSTNYLGNAGENMTNTRVNSLGHFGDMQANNTIGAGNARAAGYVGSANAWANALNNGANSYTDARAMKMY